MLRGSGTVGAVGESSGNVVARIASGTIITID